MKRLLYAGSAVSLFLIIGTANAQQPTQSSTTNTTTTTKSVIMNTIDGIDVPMDIVMYAQDKYEGHAITRVRKMVRNNAQVYQLRVDTDDIPDDYSSIFLYYDMSWKLLGDEKLSAPVVKKEVPKTEPGTPPQLEEKKETAGRGAGPTTTTTDQTQTTTPQSSTTQPPADSTKPTSPPPPSDTAQN